MGQDADELRRDIERTRVDLGGTLDAIGDRVSPSRMVERRTNRMRETVRSIQSRVMGTVHDGTQAVERATGSAVDAVREAPQSVERRTEGAPMVAGAIAFGVGFLAAAAFPPSRRERQMAPALLDEVEPMKQDVVAGATEMAHHLEEPVKQAAADVGERLKEGAREVAGEVEEAVSDRVHSS
jgi:ElaB/YqjD/DUF883 family membrane-anchored ribosome-binding protein